VIRYQSVYTSRSLDTGLVNCRLRKRGPRTLTQTTIHKSCSLTKITSQILLLGSVLSSVVGYAFQGYHGDTPLRNELREGSWNILEIYYM
jgi:hypothetical protein